MNDQQTPLIDEVEKEGGANRNARYVRQGHGRCCDSKRGTILVERLNLLLNAAWILVLSVGDHVKPGVDEDVDAVEGAYVSFMVVSGFAILVSLAAIYGANKYKIHLVALGAAYAVAHAAFAVVMDARFAREVAKDQSELLFDAYFAFPIGWALINLYWHVLFVWEVRRGIMSQRTYSHERHSCCCEV